MQNLIGKVLLERYHIQEMIGRGGMAEVYKVWDSERMVHLALKAIHEDLATDRIFLRRFKREAQTLSKLQHPNIVRFYGLEQSGALSFMLMDFVDGHSLKRLIFDQDGRPLPAGQVRKVLRAVCGALKFAHGQGFVHADIKPANIMQEPSGRVLLMDFGIARMSDVTTATMVGMGTPAYMAPEQVKGLDPTPQTDIYALGIVLYEMLTGGERPFTGERAEMTGSLSEKVRWEQLNLEPLPPEQFNPNLSPALVEVINKCLAKDPRERYADSLELLNAVELALGDGELVSKSVPEPLQELPPPLEAEKVFEVQTEDMTEKARRLVEENERLKAQLAGKEKEKEPVSEAVLEKKLPLSEASKPVQMKPAEKPADRRKLPAWAWVGGIFGVAILILLFTNWNKTERTVTPEIEEISYEVLDEDIRQSSKDGMQQVYVPAGEFEMGTKDGHSDEEPVHTVYLDAYWIDRTEVTNAMYAKCVADGSCDEPEGDYYGDANYSEHPVVFVSWYDADSYCTWAGRELPSEAEWEKAARGTDSEVFPWGNRLPGCDLTNFFECNGSTIKVGSLAAGASSYGALDMAGNVWEWVSDWYDSDYYIISPEKNPENPHTSDYKVLRGGSWRDPGYGLRSAYRLRFDPEGTNISYGFRCVSPAP